MTTFTTISAEIDGMTFDGWKAGPADGPPVLLCHGWPQNSSSFRAVAERLVAAGCQVAAFDQRGYSPGARPEPVEAYASAHLVSDLLGMADSLGWETFHLVGHDWGGMIGWLVAGNHPDRVLSYTALSIPHGRSFLTAMKTDPDQHEKSAYIRAIRERPEETAAALLADDCANLRRVFTGLDEESVEAYVSRMRDPEMLEATLKWYRAIGVEPVAMPVPVSVPTVYVWGAQDIALGRTAAEDTANHVTGPYTFIELDDVGHWVPEQESELVAEQVLTLVNR